MHSPVVTGFSWAGEPQTNTWRGGSVTRLQNIAPPLPCLSRMSCGVLALKPVDSGFGGGWGGSLGTYLGGRGGDGGGTAMDISA